MTFRQWLLFKPMQLRWLRFITQYLEISTVIARLLSPQHIQRHRLRPSYIHIKCSIRTTEKKKTVAGTVGFCIQIICFVPIFFHSLTHTFHTIFCVCLGALVSILIMEPQRLIQSVYKTPIHSYDIILCAFWSMVVSIFSVCVYVARISSDFVSTWIYPGRFCSVVYCTLFAPKNCKKNSKWNSKFYRHTYTIYTLAHRYLNIALINFCDNIRSMDELSIHLNRVLFLNIVESTILKRQREWKKYNDEWRWVSIVCALHCIIVSTRIEDSMISVPHLCSSSC